MRFIALGTTEFIKHCIKGLIDSGHQVLLLVSLPKELQPDNSIDLSEFMSEKGLDYLEVEDINASENIEILEAYSPDVILSAWPRILKQQIFSVPRFCIIGSHPTALPLNRGRHPLHWEIVLGIPKSSLSFFRMNEGIDTGRILLQVPYEIRPDDTIADLVARVNSVAYSGSYQLGQMLATGDVPEGIEQGHDKANYWRKRTRHDVIIDFRMSAGHIIRIVRSFTLPYPCAVLLFDAHVLSVVQAGLAPAVFSLEELQRMEPGKIIQASGHIIQVKAIDQIIDLTCAEPVPISLLSAKYIHPPTKYLAEHLEIHISNLR
jgi:methionyl-tRNA formyltransferase